MSLEARYKTQSRMWDCPLTGPLTDSKIKKYKLSGHYGEKAQRIAKRIDAMRKAKRERGTLKERKEKLYGEL